MTSRTRLASIGAGLVLTLLSPAVAGAQETRGDIPEAFRAPATADDFVERTVMIPMRDGVRLNTIITIPKGARDAPILFSRTPYGIRSRVSRNDSPSMAARLTLADEDFARSGYIRVWQDVRGKFGSEGAYEMMRPARGPLNPTATDHSTDAYDTIEWLLKNVPETNGRVGMIGSSYGGFTTAMALLDPHPALKAAVPQSPYIDGWMGDDWFHHGAFRQSNFDFIHMQTAQKGGGGPVKRDAWDDYDTFLRAGSAADYAAANGLDQLPFWRRILEHPNYDGFWQAQALDRLLAARPSSVPTLWLSGLWDQEDIYGAPKAYEALKTAGRGDTNWLVIGPWYHSQIARDGSQLGPFHWRGDTAEQARREIILPFFDQHLRGRAPAHPLARVTVYDPGQNRWQSFAQWPRACERGCARDLTPLYLAAGGTLSFDRPAGGVGGGGGSRGGSGGDTYVSDPAKPVPFSPRPTRFPDSDAWRTWLVRDQRFVADRPDVLSWSTPPLTEPVKIEGRAIAEIVAATTGTDLDIVVKLIDVYPAEHPSQPELGGYQLPVAMDIFRGRFRDGFEHPTAIPAGRAQRYRFALPPQNYTFKPGHRIMVQIQSTLFPLYDRNPQTFVANPQKARPGDYRKAEVTILRSGDAASAVWLPIVE